MTAFRVEGCGPGAGPVGKAAANGTQRYALRAPCGTCSAEGREQAREWRSSSQARARGLGGCDA